MSAREMADRLQVTSRSRASFLVCCSAGILAAFLVVFLVLMGSQRTDFQKRLKGASETADHYSNLWMGAQAQHDQISGALALERKAHSNSNEEIRRLRNQSVKVEDGALALSRELTNRNTELLSVLQKLKDLERQRAELEELLNQSPRLVSNQILPAARENSEEKPMEQTTARSSPGIDVKGAALLMQPRPGKRVNDTVSAKKLDTSKSHTN